MSKKWTILSIDLFGGLSSRQALPCRLLLCLAAFLSGLLVIAIPGISLAAGHPANGVGATLPTDPTRGGMAPTVTGSLMSNLPGSLVDPLPGTATLSGRPPLRRESRFLDFAPAADGLPGATGGGYASIGFSEDLMGRMNREAWNYQRRTDGNRPAAWDNFEDSEAERLRADHAERILTRSFKRAFRDRLEQIARSSASLGAAFTWIDGFGRSDSSRLSASVANHGEAALAPTSPRHFKARVGIRLGAHPRVTLKAEFFKIRGRIEVPILNDPIHISVERDFGPRSSLTLSSGIGGGDDWTRLSFQIGF